MRYFLTILLACAFFCPAICQVSGGEYFIDVDPGYGRATTLPITTGDNISNDFNLQLSAVPPGYHIVSIRAQDAQGHWSHTYSHNFYVIAGTATNTIASEYFIDTDPGYGNAINIPVAVGADSTLKYVVPLSSYNFGFHTIGLRSKDNLGKWSQTLQHTFYVSENNTPVNISSFQYYFTGAGSTDSMYTYQIPVPATSVDLDFKADLSRLEGDREYDMHIWAVNEKGVRSEVLIKKIKVCNGEPAKARFDFVVSGTQVSFVDKSAGGSKYLWNFGDSKIDSISNPLHTYDSVGIYNVKLIVSNICNADTITKQLSIVGLKSIFTNHGGNTGSVSVDVRGAGFTPGMQLFLHKNGESDIAGDTLIIEDARLIHTTFNLTNRSFGSWDVIAVFPDHTRDSILNGFRIEKGSDPKLWVSIAGPGILRIGFNQIYTVTYGNSGNTDARFVPLIISGLPKGTKIELLNPIFDIDKYPGFNNLNLPSYNIPDVFNNPTNNTSFQTYFIGNIPAGSTQTINYVFHVPQETPLRDRPTIVCALGNPVDNSSTLTENGIVIPEALECLKTLSNNILEDKLKEAAKIIDPTGILSCAVNGGYLFNQFYDDYIKKEDKGGLSQIIEASKFHRALFVTGVECIRATINVAAIIAAPEFVPALLEAQEVGFSAAVLDKTITYGENAIACGPLLKNVAINYIIPTIGNASDPNAKYGPGDSTSSHFTNTNVIPYVINFENKPSANLNAQTVAVLDTLNKSYYDYSSFGFTSVIVGDSTYSLSSPVNSFIHDFDFTSQYKVKARVVASFDTLTGIVQWKFFTIDPVTNQVTTKALDGFLPPDKVSPKGQGYVSFIVRQNANIQTGDTIHNTATIKFDYNPDITTNKWQNVFDFISPISKVQPLPSETSDTTFKVAWQGSDNASGIRSYDVYYAMDNGDYQLWLSDVSATDSSFTGEVDSSYRFFSIAKDNAGNIETIKTNAEAVTHITKRALPITSLPLQGVLNKDLTVSLSWKTLTEVNNKGFDIERNAGNGWIKIGFVKGMGNSTKEIKYSFIDTNVDRGTSYQYRYKQVDYDNRLSYSNVVLLMVIDEKGSLSLTIAPNPFAGKTNVSYTLPTNGHTTLRLRDYTGKEVAKLVDQTQQAGVYKIELNAMSLKLSSGIYFLNISNGKETLTSEIVLIR